MATKVKGDKIKEGSIPLSALDSTVQDDLSYVGTLSVENPVLILPQAFATYYIDRMYSVNPYQNTQISGINITYSVENGIGKLTADYSETSYTSSLKLYKSRRIQKYELPNTIADWNAQENEVGYIENRPCRYANTYKFNNYNYKDDTAFYVNIEYLGELWIDGMDEFGAIRVKNEYGNEPIYTFYKDFNNSNARSHLNANYADVEIGYHDIGLGYETNCLIVKTTSDDIFTRVINVIEFNKEYNYEKTYANPKDLFYVPLDNGFIPNTVIKTTPQTLSDADKNQALANLGIDPVVWKYICNPIVISENIDYDIPEDLHNILWNEDMNKLNPIALDLVTFILENGEYTKATYINYDGGLDAWAFYISGTNRLVFAYYSETRIIVNES